MAFVPGKVIRQFSLQGRKVVFRYLKKSDFEDTLKHINRLVDEKAYLIVQKKQTRGKQRKWFADALKAAKKGDRIKICVEVDGKFAGTGEVDRKKGDAHRHVGTLGIALESSFRNMGIGTELIRTLDNLARKEMKIKVLRLSYLAPNSVAKHLYEKLGFREIGRVPMGVTHYGKYHDHVLMAKVLK